MVSGAARRHPVLLAVLAALLPLLGATAVPVARADTVRYAFAASGLDGAGFQNVLAYSPFLDADGRRPILAGADVAGIHRSVDGGRTWQPGDVGLGDASIASLLFSAVTPGKVWAATDSALYLSTDFGLRWTRQPGAVNFDGNGAYHVGGAEHPRSTGTLLAEDASGAVPILYAATHTQGVKRSRDDGASWDAVALAGHHLRSIALDPANPDRLFVGDVEAGLQLSTDARSGFTFSRVTGGPQIPEELEFVGGRLYVAGGSAGDFRYDGGWQSLSAGLPAGSLWQSLTGYVDPDTGRDVLYVGCAAPSAGRHTLRSTDGGQTWQPVSAGPGVTVSSREYGSSTEWWAAVKPYLAFTAGSFVASDIAVDPDDPGKLLIAGRGGVYAGIAQPSGTAWSPAVDGLMATVNMVVAADPKLPGRVYVGNMDWTFLASDDHGVSFRGDALPVGAPTTGDVVAIDPDGPPDLPSTVYLAASRRGQNTGTGQIYSNPDPIADPAGWTDERLPVSADVVALGVGHATDGSRVLLASVTGRGLYRKEGAAWSKLGGTIPFGRGGYGTFAWVPGTPVVYAMDPAGVWRSDAAGAAGSWVLLGPGSAAYGNVSSLVLDPLHPGVLYASDDALGGVARFTGADTAAPVRETILALDDPGPIAVAPDGALLAHDPSGDRLLRSAEPTAPTPVFEDAANAFFAQNAHGIRSLSVGPDGYVYTAANRAGVTVAPPLGALLPPSPDPDLPPAVPADLTSPAQSPTGLSLTWTAAGDGAGVAGYRVLRDGEVIATPVGPGFADDGLTPGRTYVYRVQAIDTAGTASRPSEPLAVPTLALPDAAAPTTPPGLRARVVGPARVDLSWSASSDDVAVTGYRISRDGQQVAITGALGWTDTTMGPAGHGYSVEALDAAGHASPPALVSVNVPLLAPAGLTGSYYDTASFGSFRLTRVDPVVDFGWGTGRPAPGVGADTFSVRWTGRVLPTADGTWTFITRSDDGVRLWVDGRRLIDNWTTHTLTENRGSIALTADRAHDIRLEYFDRSGTATVRLLWSGPGTSRQVLASSQLLAG
jgi:hypothetical protein